MDKREQRMAKGHRDMFSFIEQKARETTQGGLGSDGYNSDGMGVWVWDLVRGQG